MQHKQATMQEFLTRIEKVLISDEEFVRLLKYPPMGFDETTQTMIPDPLDESLPNLVDDSDEYWELVSDRFRKGLKRTDIENDATVIVYMYEGRERKVFGSPLFSTKEIRLRIFIQELYESDSRISRLTTRIKQLLINEIGLAGYGKLNLSGISQYDAPLGYRCSEISLTFNILTKGM